MKTFLEFVSNDILIPPSGFSISRSEMPQIQAKDVENFITWLSEQGIKSQFTEVKIRNLKVTQSQFNFEKVKTLMGVAEKHLKKPIIVSSDNFILDGHHRFLALYNMNKNQSIKIHKIDIKIGGLLSVAREFPKSFTKGVNEKA